MGLAGTVWLHLPKTQLVKVTLHRNIFISLQKSLWILRIIGLKFQKLQFKIFFWSLRLCRCSMCGAKSERLPLISGEKSASLPSMCGSRSALYCKFPPHIEGSSANFAPHMEGSHADFAPHMEQRHSLGTKKLPYLKSVKKIPHTGDIESLDRCGS